MYGFGDPICAYRRDGDCWYPRQWYLKDASALPGGWESKYPDVFDVPGVLSDWETIRFAPSKRSGSKGCPFSNPVSAAKCPFHSSKDPHLNTNGHRWIDIDSPDAFERVVAEAVEVAGRISPECSLSINGEAVPVSPDGAFAASVALGPVGQSEVLFEADFPTAGRKQYRRVVERVETGTERLARMESEERTFKSECQQVAYVVLEKDFLDMLSSKLVLTGQVTEIANREGGGTVMTVAVTAPAGRGARWKDSLRVVHSDRVEAYRGDIVDVWGTLAYYKSSTRRDARSKPGLNARYVMRHEDLQASEAVSRDATAADESPTRGPGFEQVPAETAPIGRPEMQYWDDFRNVVDRQHETWGTLDSELYGLCERMPSHDELAQVVAKVALIGRGYATRIEAMVPSSGREGAGSAILQVAKVLHVHHQEVDEWISRLPSVEDFDDRIADIIEIHGLLTMLLQEGLSSGEKFDAPKSFASKYLHFHRPAVPIYDSYSEKSLKPFRTAAIAATSLKYNKAHEYKSYWEHCIAFHAALQSARAAGENPTVKELDAFLLSK